MASKQAIATISKLLKPTTTKLIPLDDLRIWEKELEPLDDELAVAATLRVVRMKTESFAIPPGAVYQAAREILREEYPSEGQAWYMARSVASGSKPPEGREYGPLHEALDQIGRRQVMEMEIADFGTRALFLRFYRAEVDKAVEQRLGLALTRRKQEALKGGSR